MEVIRLPSIMPRYSETSANLGQGSDIATQAAGIVASDKKTPPSAVPP